MAVNLDCQTNHPVRQRKIVTNLHNTLCVLSVSVVNLLPSSPYTPRSIAKGAKRLMIPGTVSAPPR